VLATAAIYLTFTVLVRVSGPRSLMTLAGADLACAISVGAVVGRTALLAVPTLVTGVLALVVLFGLRRVLGSIERHSSLGRLVARRPAVLMSAGRLHEEVLRRSRVTPDELRQSLRLAGITRRDQVGLVVLERSGRISVLRAGSEPEPWLLEDLPSA
jgi:uncharacterized membrane protein YcaP (DUF421 family)